jgi:hypothetical protein
MENPNNQSLLLLLSPPGGADALTRYLRAVGRAVGARSDADLARMMEAPASALANWKRRGSVSDQGRLWFEQRLITAIAVNSTEALPRTELGATAAVLNLVGRTGGDALRIGGADALFANALAFGGLLSLAQLLVELLRIGDPAAGGVDDPRVADLLEAAIPRFREAPQLSVFGKVVSAVV